MIELRDINKSFDGVTVLEGMNLKIHDGETLVVMGKSGCGKSVTLKLILRLIYPEMGEIFIDGVEILDLPEREMMEVRKKIGMLFQGGALFDSMTVWQNLAYQMLEHTEIAVPVIDQNISELLTFVGMDGSQEKHPSELSGGMQKRVALARALIMTPDYVFFDEPTTGLDPVTAGKINDLIIRTREEFGVTSVVVTHDIVNALTVGTRFAFLDSGKISFYGKKEDLRTTDNPALREFLKDASWQERY
ncbi:MAG TPA: ATP-binding cassette domain-containing protein [candidate division Zixibacteria bacterium]|nr:ATP-binding cassette domain-containing protein [candidate division Zixibacteria bacterium]